MPLTNAERQKRYKEKLRRMARDAKYCEDYINALYNGVVIAVETGKLPAHVLLEGERYLTVGCLINWLSGQEVLSFEPENEKPPLSAEAVN